MEERERSRGRTGPGWFATLLGGALLVGLGLAFGIVVGVAFDEPAMVVGDLVERGSEVPWGSDDAAEGDAVEVAGLEPLGDQLEGGELEEAAGGSPEAGSEEVAAAPPAEPARPAGPRGFAVQVGAFGDSGSAERLADTLRAKGLDVYVTPGAGGGARWRVRVGPVASREEAQTLAVTIKDSEALPTWVVEEQG